MKRHGHATMKISTIKAPGGIEKLRKLPEVIALVESFEATGAQPGNPLWVDKATKQLVAGRKRFAAALNAGLKSIDVLLVSGTPEELERMTLVENIRRNASTDAEIARLLELEHPAPPQTFPEIPDEAFHDEEAESIALGLKHQSKKDKSESIEKVAKLTGKTTAAIKQAAYRDRAKKKDIDKMVQPERPEAVIRTMALKLPLDVIEFSNERHATLTRIAEGLKAMQAEVTRGNCDSWNVLKEKLHDAAAQARALMPSSVCPYCKPIEGETRKVMLDQRKNCLACRGDGFLTVDAMSNVPEPLMARGKDAAVYIDGELKLLSELE